MKSLKSKVLAVTTILLLGFFLRFHNYDTYPQRGASSDEYAYAFLGMSLLTKGVPISWSAFPDYKHLQHLTIRNLYFPIVYPYFDHPPFPGFLTGGLALLNGENTFEKVQLSTIRLVPVFLSVLTMLLLFIIANNIYGYKTAIWSLLIYATTTIFIMNSRLGFAENVLTPLFLGALYAYMQFRKNISYKKVFLLALLCGISFWTKEVGIVVFLTLAYFFIIDKIKLKYTLLLFAISFLIIAGYIGYGMYYDKNLFFAILSEQSNRNIGPRTLLYLMSTPIIVNKFYYDGWYFFGLIAFLFSFSDYKKNMMVLVPGVIYFLMLLFSLTQEGEMGWYMIPLFPFMAIATGSLLVEHFKKVNWFVFVMLLFVGLYTVRYLYEYNFGLVPLQFRIILLLMFLPFIILMLLKKEKAFIKLSELWFYLFILGNIILSYTYVHPA